jgi:predicted nucleic acid-binding protein
VILVDTTVLVYAVGDEHALRGACQSLISLVALGEIRATTTVEVIQEFAHVRTRRRSRSDAAALARNYADLFAPLGVVDSDDLAAGLDLFERSAALGPFDAALAARAARANATLVSTDKAFGKVSGLSYLNPSDPRFESKLRRT